MRHTVLHYYRSDRKQTAGGIKSTKCQTEEEKQYFLIV